MVESIRRQRRKLLTDKQVSELPRRGTPYFHPDPEMPSHGVRVRPNRPPNYYVITRDPFGKQRWVKLGSSATLTAWLIAALNSVEPFVMQLATIDIFYAGEEWAKQRRPAVVEMIGKRLARLSNALGDKPYLDGDAFTAGDLMMTSVLRSLDGKDLLERHPNLVAYKARCQARPAFEAALAAQLADFEQREAVSA